MIPMNTIINQKGLTLLELVISIGLTAMIMISGIFLYFAGIKSWQKSDLHLELQQNARIAIKTISEAVRNAKTVEVLDGGGEYTTEGNRIYIVTHDGYNIEFYSKDRQLLRKKDGKSNPVANYVESVVFKKETSLISVSIEMKKEDYSLTLETKIFPRNSD